MGLDCTLITEKQNIDLDRLYVFSEEIKTGREYSKQEFLSLIKKLEERAAEIGYQDEENNRYWIQRAKENAGERNVIYAEDEEGCSLDRLTPIQTNTKNETNDIIS